MNSCLTHHATVSAASIIDHVERGYGLNQLHSFLVPSRVSTVNLSMSASSQTFITSNLCTMISLMLTTALRYPCPVCLPIAHLQDHAEANGSSARHSGAVRSWVSSEIDLLKRFIRRRSCSARRRPSTLQATSFPPHAPRP